MQQICQMLQNFLLFAQILPKFSNPPFIPPTPFINFLENPQPTRLFRPPRLLGTEE